MATKLIFCLLLASIAYASEVDHTRDALVDLFKSCNGSNWKKRRMALDIQRM